MVPASERACKRVDLAPEPSEVADGEPISPAGTSMPDRADAVALLEEWVESEALRKHMYAVEAAVRHYARLRGADEDLWGLAALLHDLDWEKYPDEHPNKAVAHLQDAG
jgi:predicted hydrolase (HD superfamily)